MRCHVCCVRDRTHAKAAAKREAKAKEDRLVEATERDRVDAYHEVVFVERPVDLAAAWRTRAACIGRTDEMYPASVPGRSWSSAWAVARAICASCSVTDECLADVMAWERSDTRHGMFGGLTPTERTALVKVPRTKATA